MARYDDNTAYDMHAYAMPEQTAPQHERVRRDWNVVEGGNSPHATTPLSPVVITVAKCVGALLATVLLTGLVNPQVVRTAEMMDMKCVVFVRGKLPDAQMLALARERGIVVMSTLYRMYIACGLLYSRGLAGE